MTTATDAEIWDAAETAAFLRCDPRTVSRLRHTAGLPSFKFGRKRLFDPAKVRAWLRDREEIVTPPAPTTPAAPVVRGRRGEPQAPAAVAGWDGVRRSGGKRKGAG